MEPLREFGVTPVALDVTDQASIAACLEAVGEVDVLINNAGYGYFGPIEVVSDQEARRQLDVNLFGLAALCRAFLPGMRERGSGRIINVASVAGRACLYFGGWYNVSKFAVEAFSDALRMEVSPFGIDVVIIEPGGIKTEWGIIAADHLSECTAGTAYEAPALREAGVMKTGYTIDLLSKPSTVTRGIVRAVKARRPRARYHMGAGSGSIIFWHTVLPTRLWDAIMRMLAHPGIAKFVSKLNKRT